ncbi:MAG: non-canonical purine NTP pyrophosphatase, partial [Catalinimonas sp.]
MTPTLCFATNNPHKLAEVRRLLRGVYEVRGLADIGCREELPETGDTLD